MNTSKIKRKSIIRRGIIQLHMMKQANVKNFDMENDY